MAEQSGRGRGLDEPSGAVDPQSVSSGKVLNAALATHARTTKEQRAKMVANGDLTPELNEEIELLLAGLAADPSKSDASPTDTSPGVSGSAASPEKIRLGSLSPSGAGPGGLVPQGSGLPKTTSAPKELPESAQPAPSFAAEDEMAAALQESKPRALKVLPKPPSGLMMDLPGGASPAEIQYEPPPEPPDTRAWGSLDVGAEGGGKISVEDLAASPEVPTGSEPTGLTAPAPALSPAEVPTGKEPVEPAEGVPLGFPEVAPAEREEVEAPVELPDKPETVNFLAEIWKWINPKEGGEGTPVTEEDLSGILDARNEEIAAAERLADVELEGVAATGELYKRAIGKGEDFTAAGVAADERRAEERERGQAKMRMSVFPSRGMRSFSFPGSGMRSSTFPERIASQQGVEQDALRRFNRMDVEREELGKTELSSLITAGEEAQTAYDKHEFTNWWDELSTRDKILGVISLFLGGFGAGMTGTPNFAMQIINKKIDDDMARQKAELEKKKYKIGQIRNRYDRTRQSLLDWRDTAIEKRKAIYDESSRVMESIDAEKELLREEYRDLLTEQDIERMSDLKYEEDSWRMIGLTLEKQALENASPEIRAKRDVLLAGFNSKAEEKVLEGERYFASLQQNQNQHDSAQKVRVAGLLEARQSRRDSLAQADDLATQRTALLSLGIMAKYLGKEETNAIMAAHYAGTLDIARLKMKLDILKAKAAGEAGRDVPAGTVVKLAVVEGTEDIFEQVEAIHDDLSDFWITRATKSLIPYTDESTYNKTVDGLSRSYAASIEGGRISDVDAQAYRRMFPDASDPKWVVVQKLDALKRVAQARSKNLRKELRAAGFSVAQSEEEKDTAYRAAVAKIPSLDDFSDKFGFEENNSD